MRRKKELIDAMRDAIARGFHLGPTSMNINLCELDPDNISEEAQNIIQIFAYSAPGKGFDNKVNFVKNLNEAVRNVVDWPNLQVVVIIKEHPHENVGVNGLLRAYDADTLKRLAEIKNMK